jgi:hypothetical protein
MGRGPRFQLVKGGVSVGVVEPARNTSLFFTFATLCLGGPWWAMVIGGMGSSPSRGGHSWTCRALPSWKPIGFGRGHSTTNLEFKRKRGFVLALERWSGLRNIVAERLSTPSLHSPPSIHPSVNPPIHPSIHPSIPSSDSSVPNSHSRGTKRGWPRGHGGN